MTDLVPVAPVLPAPPALPPTLPPRLQTLIILAQSNQGGALADLASLLTVAGARAQWTAAYAAATSDYFEDLTVVLQHILDRLDAVEVLNPPA